MQLSVTFRRMDASEAVKNHIVDKLQRIKKFFSGPIRAQVVLSSEGYRNKADISITLHNGLSIKGREETDDMYSSIDQVIDKIERQIKKYKDKITRHRPTAGPEVLVQHEVMQPSGHDEKEAEGETEKTGEGELKIIKSTRFFAKPMTPQEAILQMDLLNNNFLVFSNTDTRDVNVVYKRSDGQYGLIVTGQSAESRV